MQAITSGSCYKTPRSFATTMESSSLSAAGLRAAQRQWHWGRPVPFCSHHRLPELSHTVETASEACRPQLFSRTLQESQTTKLLTSEQLPSVGLIAWRRPLRSWSLWRRLTMEGFGLPLRVAGFSISRRGAFQAFRMAGLIRRLTVSCLCKIRNCGWYGEWCAALEWKRAHFSSCTIISSPSQRTLHSSRPGREHLDWHEPRTISI